MTGKLFIVATPLGNLQDITLRALSTLREVDVIYCEDTRHSLKLLQAHGIRKPLVSLHDYNELARISGIAEQLKAGKSLALISDAGTPLISDPGFKLIRELAQLGLPIESIPGPCAAINALVLSGLPTDRFYFMGFLPPKSAARLRHFSQLQEHPSTLIFYESTHRIEKFLRDAYEILGPRPMALLREMTKQFEEVLRGTLGEVGVKQMPRSWKGEFVVVIGGKIDV